MNTEDDEFNRVEREAKTRMMAVRYAMEHALRQKALQALHNENERLGLYDDVYPSIPFVTAEEWAKLKEQK